nr:MAG: DUF1292 domain-containing protein [[Clostridium] cellulosi]
MGREPDGTLITLLDENGEEKEFEHLASLEYEGSTYVALIPAFQKPEELVESDGNLVILKIESDDKGEDILVTVDDDDEFYTVSKKFEKMLENEYEIIDDEDETNDVQ